jgi:hypothetical protein
MIGSRSQKAIALSFALVLGSVQTGAAQTKRATLAVEADAISFFIGGYSGILNVSLGNGLQAAFGSGSYDVPSFLLEGDANYDSAQWKARSTSVQVLRVGYRFNGPMKNGPVMAAIILNQSWRLRSEALGGETRFRPISAGLSAGYYLHVGPHFYLYPTAAFTYNWVQSGEASVGGARYEVKKLGPNGSLHAGWEFAL